MNDNIELLTRKYNEKLQSKVNGEFEMLGEFDDKVITLKHNECQRLFELNPRYFMYSLKCPLCEKEKKREEREKKSKKKVDEFKQQILELVGDEYSVLSKYIDQDTRKVKLKHNSCGYEYEIKPKAFLDGRRCPMCTKTKFKTPEEYQQDFNKVSNGEFELLTPYERATKKVKVKHINCKEKDNIFEISPSYFLRDNRCPNCQKSKAGAKKNTEIFKAQTYDLYGTEFEVISEYVSSDTPLIVRHECGTEKKVVPSIFLAGKYSCVNCRKNKK